ncbi:MAG: hypothetical protein JWO47_696 [Candidatus Saccharibacteria bacterium]|nr:hypothetical protein [Candidatus Saccharibacteria bacterium]
MIHFHANYFEGTTQLGPHVTRTFVINEAGFSVPGAITAFEELELARVITFAPHVHFDTNVEHPSILVRNSVKAGKHIAKVLRLSDWGVGNFSNVFNTDALDFWRPQQADDDL